MGVGYYEDLCVNEEAKFLESRFAAIELIIASLKVFQYQN